MPIKSIGCLGATRQRQHYYIIIFIGMDPKGQENEESMSINWRDWTPANKIFILESDHEESNSISLMGSMLLGTPNLHFSPSQEESASYDSPESFSDSSSERPDMPMIRQVSTVSGMKVEGETAPPKRSLQEVNTDFVGCTCPKSKCRSLYCACLARGRTCIPGVCGCNDCQNVEETVRHRQRREKSAVERKCTCTTNHCVRGYCVCFKNGAKCGADCSCIGCQNMDENAPPLRGSPRKLRKHQEVESGRQ